ncbi:MAG TPA: K(+)-transporting ATPase subunit C [Candidatus Paceibacterota bacterium]|nr:K(+)-transporting ATPase subunit C [Candidatus Paceibacterota bacterium]
MHELLRQLKVSAIVIIVFAVVLCGVYPVVVWVLGQVLFPFQSNGSLITDATGQVVGSAIIGQQFAGPQYFEPRPSYAGNGYDATLSGGSNLGPTSQKLATNIQTAVAEYRKENKLPVGAPVPADAVTGSASGLDPHISIANAQLQALRVAKARKTTLANVQALIGQHTDGRSLGIFGEPGVNVLTLNIALDAMYPMKK